ncbi:limbin [Suricata suricatta]|uniref:limbin n=1 Tax=Suricata suricatta TaxID=37032 RepID=UPI0011557648|nr:limbin [Suricata suricatta]
MVSLEMAELTLGPLAPTALLSVSVKLTAPGASLAQGTGLCDHKQGCWENHPDGQRQWPRSYLSSPWRPAQDLPLLIWPNVESSRFNTEGGAPSGRKSSRRSEVFNQLPASAASRGPWTPPTFALTPSGPRKTLSKRESPRTQRLHGDLSRDVQGVAEGGVIFQKCAVVSGQSEVPTAQVSLLVDNARTPTATNLSDLLILDNITGLSISGSTGNRTSPGFQTFRKKFLQVGDSFSVSYTASIQAGDVGSGDVLVLPAWLTLPSSALGRTQSRAPFDGSREESLTVVPNHGLHAAGFFIASIASFVLTWVTLCVLARCQCLKGSPLARHQVQHHENKLEYSQFTSADGLNEDLALNDQMIDILSSEDPGGMLQALEELEIATLIRADSDLETCRTQISRDVIALLLRNLASSGHLSPQVERRMGAVFKKQFLLLEKEIQEEYDRKMVALTAECDLEMRKKTENQYQREMAAMEEAEELLKRVSERWAMDCTGLLRSLHGLEQEQLRRSLALQREEDFAQARRQLAVFQRSELHRIFFTQIGSATVQGELQPEAARRLLQDYSDIQEKLEELMDFFQASKRYHLSKRFGHREYLVQNMQSSETRMQGLLSAADALLTLFIQKHERAGYLDEDQMEALLERTQTEVFSIKQKLDNDLKQEKKKLYQKLILKRRREMLQKLREQRRELLSVGEALRAAEDAGQYLERWGGLLAEHGATLETLQERLDQAALEDLRALTLSLSEKAAEELRRLQGAAVTQELLKRKVPWLFLQQALEEHGRELAARARRLEGQERDRDQEGVQSVRQRLQDDALEASTEEQAELRRWERLIFAKLCSSPSSQSEEELLRMKQEVHGCFAQMDRSLALPKIRARVLLQQLQTAWREAEFQKLDQVLSAPELQQQSKARKSRSKSKSRSDLLRKCIEDKIQLFEEQGPEDLVEKVRGELLRERVQQLEAQEARFAESLVSLQFRKAARTAQTLGAYTALLSIRDLLLEELSESETLTTLACEQILGSHGPELQELERKLEEKLVHQEAAQLQRALASQQQWAGDGPGLLHEHEDTDSDRQVSAVLQQALGKAQKLLEHHQQSWREERDQSVVLEDLLEKMEFDTFSTLYSQELRLASYLSRLAMVPTGTLRRLLSVALPAASPAELLAALDSGSQKHPDPSAENDGGGEQADLGRRGRHRGWWEALERRLRGELVSRGLEKALWARGRKESILWKPCPPLRERLVLPGKGSWPHLSLEPIGEAAAVPIVGAEAIDLLNTGEKLFIFRNPKELEISLHAPPRRKKKNFLNAKKATWASGMD